MRIPLAGRPDSPRAPLPFVIMRTAVPTDEYEFVRRPRASRPNKEASRCVARHVRLDTPRSRFSSAPPVGEVPSAGMPPTYS